MEKLGEELFDEYTMPKEVKSAMEGVDQIFGKSKGVVSELGDLNLKIAELKKRLRKCKNAKNHRLTLVNEQMNEKRNNLRRQIASLNDQIEDLKLQMEGKH